MAERPFPAFNFANLTNYTGPIEGSDLFPYVGWVKGRVLAGAKTHGKQPPHNPSIMWTIEGADEGSIGLTIKTTKAYAGVDKSGNPLERQTADVLFSVGYTPEILQQYAAQGAQVTPDDVINMVAGRDIYFYVGRYTDENGIQRSSVDQFTDAAGYEEKKKVPGAFRQDPPAQARAIGGRAQGPATAPVGGMNIGGAVRGPTPGAPAAGFAAPGFAAPTAGAPAAFAAPPAPRAAAPANAGAAASPTLALPSLPPPPARA